MAHKMRHILLGLATLAVIFDAAQSAQASCTPSVVGDANKNTCIGTGALGSNYGSSNTALGYQALFSNVLGYYNTAVGHQALRSNNGWYNTAIGQQALFENISGEFNTAVGYSALWKNTTGRVNTAVGGVPWRRIQPAATIRLSGTERSSRIPRATITQRPGSHLSATTRQETRTRPADPMPLCITPLAKPIPAWATSRSCSTPKETIILPSDTALPSSRKAAITHLLALGRDMAAISTMDDTKPETTISLSAIRLVRIGAPVATTLRLPLEEAYRMPIPFASVRKGRRPRPLLPVSWGPASRVEVP